MVALGEKFNLMVAGKSYEVSVAPDGNIDIDGDDWSLRFSTPTSAKELAVIMIRCRLGYLYQAKGEASKVTK